MLTTQLDRSIVYRPDSALGYIRHLRAQKTPWKQTLVQTILHLGLRFGQAEAVNENLARLLARRPRRLQDYIQANRRLWTETA